MAILGSQEFCLSILSQKHMTQRQNLGAYQRNCTGMEEASFDALDWISQGKTWATVPGLVKSAGQKVLEIPACFEPRILPPPNISIRAMLNFPVPTPQLNDDANMAAFFKKDPPDDITERTLLQLRHLATPGPKVVSKLIDRAPQAWLDGYQSVVYSHLQSSVSTHYPLWVVSFWYRIGEFRTGQKNEMTAGPSSTLLTLICYPVPYPLRSHLRCAALAPLTAPMQA
jgi:hypothetical protein